MRCRVVPFGMALLVLAVAPANGTPESKRWNACSVTTR